EATPPIMAENQMGRTEKAVMAGQITPTMTAGTKTMIKTVVMMKTMAMMGIVGMMMKTEKMKAGMTKAKKTKTKKTKVKMTKRGMKKMIQMMMGLKTMVIKTMTRTVEKTMEMLETMMNKMDRTIIAETMMT